MSEELLKFFMGNLTNTRYVLDDGILIIPNFLTTIVQICDRGVEDGHLTKGGLPNTGGYLITYILTEETKNILRVVVEL